MVWIGFFGFFIYFMYAGTSQTEGPHSVVFSYIYIYIYIYIYTSVDPSLCSDVSYVEPKEEWNCLNRCCELKFCQGISHKKFVIQFRVATSSEKVSPAARAARNRDRTG